MSDCAGVGQMQAKRLRTATDLSATVSILHGCDYVGRAGLFRAVWRYLRYRFSVAILHEFGRRKQTQG
jgi:hypothetical protein